MNRVSIGSDNGCAYPAPSHNLTQSRVIVDWTLRNKLRWDLIKLQKFLFTKLHLKRLFFFAWYGQSDSREIIKLPRPLWNIDPHVYRSKVWDDKYFHIWLIPFTHWCLLYMCIQVSDVFYISLQWCHNDRDGVSNHQFRHCLFNRLFRRRSKKTSKLRVTGFCAGNSPVTGEFPAQRAGDVENVSIWWRHHVYSRLRYTSNQRGLHDHGKYGGKIIYAPFYDNSCCLVISSVRLDKALKCTGRH